MEDPNDSHEDMIDDSPEKGSAAGLVFLTLLVLVLIAGVVGIPWAAEWDKTAHLFVAPEWWATNIGEYHPLILHLPIGIVTMVAIMEILGWITFGKYKPATSFALFVGFITGILACITGYFELQIGGYKSEAWDNHMWSAIIFVGVLGLAYLARIWGNRNGSRGPIYALLLLGAAGVMGFGAHIGGVETHKVDPIENTLIGAGLIEGKEKKVPEPPSEAPIEERLAFGEVVLPILENKCLDCHSEEAGKSKGGLYMDTYENLLIGGDLADDEPENYSTLVPGNAEKSYMIQVMNLPMDDDMHMPPEKKPQMDASEIKIITWWVNNIPESETLEDKTLGEMGVPPEIIEAVGSLMSPQERKEMEAKAKAESEAIEKARAEKREALQNSMSELKQQETFKTALDYTSQESTDLEFSAVSLREKFNDQELVKLDPVASAITSLRLGATSVSEAAVVAEIPKMTELEKLDLSQTEVGDGAMDAVSKLENLTYLNLYGTQVTDAGIMKLKTLTKLENLYLWQSKATPAGAEKLKKELPGVEITFGVE